MADYVLVGGGEFAREINDWFTPMLSAQGSRFIGYVDDAVEPMKPFNHDLPQLSTIADYRPEEAHRLVMAIAGPVAKDAVAGRLAERRGTFSTLIHPTAWVSASAQIGTGVIVAPFGHVSANARVSDYVMINCYSGAGHDVFIDRSVTLSSHVDLTGRVSVGALSFFGSGAVALPDVRIGRQCTIGAGAVVVRSVADGTTIYSAPGRRL